MTLEDLEETLLGDLNRFQMRFVALRQQMIADGIRYGLPIHEKDLQILLERVESEGASFAQVTLPLLGRALDQGLVSGFIKTPAHFSVMRNTRLPRLFFTLFQRVFNDLGELRNEPCITTIYFLRQLLLFDSKLITEPTANEKQKAVQGFVDRQKNLRKVRLDVNNPVLLRAQWLLGRVLRSLDLTDIQPGHGPGVVSERYNRSERWDFSSWPAKAERYYPYGVYGTSSMRATLEQGSGIPLIKNKCTRCILVPKDFRGPRLISAENTVNQYLQQGQMKAMMQYIDKHRILRQSIRLRDQTHNQILAQRAYENGSVTLDLSNASDTVSAVLFWFLFAKVPKLRAQLMSTRSDYMLYEEQQVKIVAFAPMGSATCFPVESLVFWALTIASLGHVRSQSGHPDGIDVLSRDIAVFGDDIIVPGDALSTLVSTLESVGCEPNMSKTCFATPFRESCGTEWFSGSDITIIRNRRYHYGDSAKFSNHPVLLELQRKFFLLGLYSTAKQCEVWAREIYPVLTIPISSYPRLSTKSHDLHTSTEVCESVLDGSRGLWRCKLLAEDLRRPFALSTESRESGAMAFFNRSEFAADRYPVAIGWEISYCKRLPVRFNRDLQRLEFRAPRIFQDSMSWQTEGYGRLFARLSSDSTERFVHRDRKIKMAWSYIPFFNILSDISE